MDYGTILEERTNPAVLMNAREQYMRQCARGDPSAASTFAFAHAMIGSKNKLDVKEGIVCLEKLLRDDEDRTSKRNYVYYLAVAHARIKQYDLALGYIDVLLDAEGDNQQAKTLKESIKSAMTHDGLIGAAIVGGGALALAGLVAIFSMSRK
ncbi:FIS1-related protein fis-2 [Caenorhabditis elegans]|uniref:FIS1-related protein fis-2 n=1 Tax=Caenorhabditis elegans TaxID=6239 RepID=FIS12_CAEEL|nr:FIS1-related protein fis-2 [Caenorhabditis elegans]Q6AHP8.1 RecName: Full=FIS1-related protein fis-2; AltName: Full=Mitochondrial fission 1 protein fis-2 [Caenorhabditis elegans]CCD69413.1 FIS1-related protein fis-2 [Caenorhabditis elegans]|eukprot:NP_001024560.1 Mitochondrial fission 1 protein [Caenorhabditis elegans]